MQPCLFIIILVLKSERLMRVLVNPLILFQTTPGGVFAVPQQIAMDVGHLAWCADVVGVEIGEVLLFVLVVAEDLGQGFIAVLLGVDIGVVAFVGIFLQ